MKASQQCGAFLFLQNHLSSKKRAIGQKVLLLMPMELAKY